MKTGIQLLFVLLISSSLAHAQDEAASHVELNTRVLKQIVNPMDSTEVAYLTPDNVYVGSALETNGAISTSYIELPTFKVPQDIAYRSDGLLFGLLSDNYAVDGVQLESLSLVQYAYGRVIPYTNISDSLGIEARLVARDNGLYILEGRSNIYANQHDGYAIIHAYDYPTGLLFKTTYNGPVKSDLYFNTSGRYHSLHSDDQNIFQLFDQDIMMRLDIGAFSLVEEFIPTGFEGLSLQHVAGQVWSFERQIASDLFQIRSLSTGRVSVPSNAIGPVADVVASPSGSYVARLRDDNSEVVYGDLFSFDIERVPFYEAEMVELIALNTIIDGKERLAFALGTSDVDRYQQYPDLFCPSLTRATFLIDYNDRSEIYQPRSTPAISGINFSDIDFSYSLIPTTGDTLFLVSATGNLQLTDYNGEVLGYRESLTSPSGLYQRGCQYANYSSTPTIPFTSTLELTERPKMSAWLLSIDGWPTTPFADPSVFNLPGISSLKNVTTILSDVFPNPSASKVTISSAEVSLEGLRWTLIGMDGRSSSITPKEQSEIQACFTLTGIPAGVYQLAGRNEQRNVIARIMIN